MNQLTQAFTEVEEKLRSLLEEVDRLRPYVMALEEENIRLKLETAISAKETERVTANVKRLQGVAHDNLIQLYSDGFHICHLHFGQPLDGNCLFCVGFLHLD